MKIFVMTIVLLLAGLVFIAPPLIAALPVLVVALLLIGAPLLPRMLRNPDRDRSEETPIADGVPRR